MRATATFESLTFRPSRRKWLWMLLGSIAVTAGFVWMQQQEGGWGPWIGIVLCGVAVVVSLAQLVPGTSKLRLTRDHFEITTMWRSRSFRWIDAVGFDTECIGGRMYVVWDWVPGAKMPRGTALTRKLTGAEAALPDSYGRTPDALAAIMNEWHARAAGSPARKAKK